MAAPFPHRYQMDLTWPGQGPATALAPPRPALTVGPPPEFDGGDGWWSPEQLLLTSVAGCLTATYQALLARDPVPLDGYRCHAEGVLEKTREGLQFTSITLSVTLQVTAEHAPRAEELLRRAKKYCFVASSLKPPVELRVVIASHETAPVTLSSPAAAR